MALPAVLSIVAGLSVGGVIVTRVYRWPLCFLWQYWKTRRLARLVRDADFEPESRRWVERTLLIGWYVSCGLVDPRIVSHALEYLKYSGDGGKWRRGAVMGALLLVMGLEGTIVASLVTDVLLVDNPYYVRIAVAIPFGLIGGIVGGLLTHMAGGRLRLVIARIRIRQWATPRRLRLPDGKVSINDPQGKDGTDPLQVRIWNRAVQEDSLLPVWAASIYFAVISGSATTFRASQYFQLSVAGVPDLATKPEMVASLLVVVTVLAGLHGVMGWLGYATTLVGQDSAEAMRMLRNGGVRSVAEAVLYRTRLLADAERLQGRLYEHIARWQPRSGNGGEPAVPLIDPAELLDECILNGDWGHLIAKPLNQLLAQEG